MERQIATRKRKQGPLLEGIESERRSSRPRKANHNVKPDDAGDDVVVDHAASEKAEPQAAVAVRSEDVSVYQRAIQSLKNAPDRIVGRVEQRRAIHGFCEKHLKSHSPGALYVSGKPGTGKTALVYEVTQELLAEYPKTRVARVNCMGMRDPSALRTAILDALEPSNRVASSEAALSVLEKKYLFARDEKSSKSKPMLLLVLDEVDQLASHRGHNLHLYKIFEWPARFNVILIGIANALDLIERMVPLLASAQLQPEKVQFTPYKKADIVDIVHHRLASLQTESGEPLLEEAMLQFCAAKVATESGDLRRALDVCQQLIAEKDSASRPVASGRATKAEKGGSRSPVKKPCFLSSPCKSPRAAKAAVLAASPKTKVSPSKTLAAGVVLSKHAMGAVLAKSAGLRNLCGSSSSDAHASDSALSSASSSPASSPTKLASSPLPRTPTSTTTTAAPTHTAPLSPTRQQKTISQAVMQQPRGFSLVQQCFSGALQSSLQCLPVLQKVLVCAVANATEASKETRVAKVFEEFYRLCKMKSLDASSSREDMVQMLSSLQSAGVVSMRAQKGGAAILDAKVTLRPSYSDVLAAYEKQELFRSFLTASAASDSGSVSSEQQQQTKPVNRRLLD